MITCWEDERVIDDDRDLYDDACFDTEDDTADPELWCEECGTQMRWDSGDSDVGLPGAWYCPACEGEEE